MKQENERREFPEEMVEVCGYAQIPNPVLWKEMVLSYPVGRTAQQTVWPCGFCGVV